MPVIKVKRKKDQIVLTDALAASGDGIRMCDKMSWEKEERKGLWRW